MFDQWFIFHTCNYSHHTREPWSKGPCTNDKIFFFLYIFDCLFGTFDGTFESFVLSEVRIT